MAGRKHNEERKRRRIRKAYGEWKEWLCHLEWWEV